MVGREIKGAGRPTRRAGERLSKNRTFRVRPQLDEQLADAAGSSGRSVSEEIELRLEQSFAKQQSMLEALDLIYGREGAAISIFIAELTKRFAPFALLLSASRGEPEKDICWVDDPFLFAEFSSAVKALLDAMRPAGEAAAPTPRLPEELHAAAPVNANRIEETWRQMTRNLGQKELGGLFAGNRPVLEKTGWAALVRERVPASIREQFLDAARDNDHLRDTST